MNRNAILMIALTGTMMASAPALAITLTNQDKNEHTVTVDQGETQGDQKLAAGASTEIECKGGASFASEVLATDVRRRRVTSSSSRKACFTSQARPVYGLDQHAEPRRHKEVASIYRLPFRPYQPRLRISDAGDAKCILGMVIGSYGTGDDLGRTPRIGWPLFSGCIFVKDIFTTKPKTSY